MGAAVIAAAAVAKRKQDIIDRFVDAGAVSPERAVSLDAVGVEPHTRLTRELFHEEIIRTTADGAFWVDLERYAALRRRRLSVVAAIGGIVLVVALVVAWWSAR
jgi:hypothetical protein